jgi:DNA-binding MarR family transcriptional regulator
MADRPARTAFLLSQLGAAAAARFSARVRAIDLTESEAGVIRLLGRQPGISQRELADHLGTAPSRIVAIIDSLVARDLVTRTRSSTDRRNYELALTEPGRSLLRRLRTIAETAEEDFLAPLSPAERASLHGSLAALAAAHGLSSEVHAGTAPRGTDHP